MSMNERLKKVGIAYQLGIFVAGYLGAAGPHAGDIIAYATLGDHGYLTEEQMNEKLCEMSRLLRTNLPDNLGISGAVNDALSYCMRPNVYKLSSVQVPGDESYNEYSLPPRPELKAVLEPLGLWGVL